MVWWCFGVACRRVCSFSREIVHLVKVKCAALRTGTLGSIDAPPSSLHARSTAIHAWLLFGFVFKDQRQQQVLLLYQLCLVVDVFGRLLRLFMVLSFWGWLLFAIRLPVYMQVPMSLVYRKDTYPNGPVGQKAPCMLYGYGSYGASIEPSFDFTR